MHNTLISELKSLQPTAPVFVDAGLIFSGKASGRLIQSYGKPTAYTPIIDPNYLFHESSRDIIVWLMNPADPLYAFGPTGCGKTSCIKQLAARLNYPVFEVTGHGRLEFADLTGHLAVKNGNMTYEYGPLALAMRYGGILLLNEIDLTSPEVAAGLNTVLDGSPLCIAENGGELIAPHPLFHFVATANTNGGGDDTGLYQGTQRQNLAWLDRFVLCEVGYPAPEVEKALLTQRFPVLPEELSHKLVDFAGEVRKLFMGEGDGQNLTGSIEVTLSTRTLLRWAELTIHDWIAKHAEWGNIIARSVVSPDYVRARMDFCWQMSPLRTLHNKLMGLSFVEPHVVPVADIIHMALTRVPRKGNITGNR